MNASRILAIAAAVLGVVLLAALALRGGVDMAGVTRGAYSDTASIVFMLGALMLVGGGAVAAFAREGWKALRYIAVWIGIGGLIALLYMLLYGDQPR